jgi:hypothetical protein
MLFEDGVKTVNAEDILSRIMLGLDSTGSTQGSCSENMLVSDTKQGMFSVNQNLPGTLGIPG